MEGSVERNSIYFKKDKKNEKKIQEKKGGGNIRFIIFYLHSEPVCK